MKCKLWTPEENSIVKEHYPTMKNEELMKQLPNRTWKAIRLKALRLGITKRPSWTTYEDSILEEWFCEIPHTELLGKLPDRGYDAVVTRGRSLFPNRYRPTTNGFIRKCPECGAPLDRQDWDTSWVCPSGICSVIKVSYKHQRNGIEPEINKVIYESQGLYSGV